MLRFLWVADPFDKNSKIIHLRFTRLVFGLRPSPAILASVIAHHIQKYSSQHPHVVKILGKSFYVDDFITSVATLGDATKPFELAKHIMLQGGFNLRKWQSNSAELIQQIS